MTVKRGSMILSNTPSSETSYPKYYEVRNQDCLVNYNLDIKHGSNNISSIFACFKNIDKVQFHQEPGELVMKTTFFKQRSQQKTAFN